MNIAYANVERFPPRRSAVIWLLRHADTWLVLGGSSGWLHGDYHSALADAEWLSENLDLPILAMT
jgi:hypothetical protein